MQKEIDLLVAKSHSMSRKLRNIETESEDQEIRIANQREDLATLENRLEV